MSDIKLSKGGPSVDTGDASVTVTVTPAPVAGETLKFVLTVLDDLNPQNASPQATAVVSVQDLPRVVKLSGPATVSVTSTIPLTATATPEGHIKIYRWQLLQP